MKRLFFALWPDEQTRQQCEDIQSLLPQSGIKPVSKNNLHVTLVFLGNVDADCQAALVAAASAIPAADLHIVFEHLSFWQKPEILCLTGHAVGEGLQGLVQQLSSAASNLHIPLDERPYQPHVTLARKAKQMANIEFAPIHWRSQRYCLVESCSLPTGVEYRPLHYWGKTDDTLSAGKGLDQLDRLFTRLAQSKFRSQFHLQTKDLQYLQNKGLPTVLDHARDFIGKRLAPAVIANDGKQTPFRGHPVFVAQHATACCCRGCLQKWHGLEAGRPLTASEQDYLVAVLAHWLQSELARWPS